MERTEGIAAEHWGRLAEVPAALASQLRGYRILARHVRNPHGEVDLIARRGDTSAFVKVKARPTVTAGLEAAWEQSWQCISGAAEAWTARNMPLRGDFCWRHDLVAVCPWHWPIHLHDVWRPDFALTVG